MKSPTPHDIVNNICRRVAELPGRDSPADWPAAMLVTGPELALIVREEMTTLADECMRMSHALGKQSTALRLAEEDTATAERTADTMRDLVDDMTAEVQRLRGRVSRAFWGASVALALLAGSQLWRAYA